MWCQSQTRWLALTSAQSWVRALLKPIARTSSSACWVSEQIVGPKPEECSSGRTLPTSWVKSATGSSAAQAAAAAIIAAERTVLVMGYSFRFRVLYHIHRR